MERPILRNSSVQLRKPLNYKQVIKLIFLAAFLIGFFSTYPQHLVLAANQYSPFDSPGNQRLDFISIDPTFAQLNAGGNLNVVISYLYPNYGEICISAVPDSRLVFATVSPQCGLGPTFSAFVSVDVNIQSGNYQVTFQALQHSELLDEAVLDLTVLRQPTATPPPPPTRTFTFTPPPTFTPTATWTFTPTPTNTPTFTPTPTATEFVMPPSCLDYTARIFSEDLGILDIQALRNEAQRISEEARARIPCAREDIECVRREMLKEIYGGLVPFSVQQNINTPFERFPAMGLIQRVLLDPVGAQACGPLNAAGWELIIQFSVYGTRLDGFALHSPANILIRDLAGRRTGFLRDGSVVLDIPETLALKVGESEFIISPADTVEAAEIEGTGEGTFALDVVHNDGEIVKDVGFEEVPVNENSKAQLDLRAEEPTLALDLFGDGVFQSMPPKRVKPITALIIVPPTETPTATASLTPTATPVLGVPQDVRNAIWIILIIGAGVLVGIVVLAMGIAWYRGRG